MANDQRNHRMSREPRRTVRVGRSSRGKKYRRCLLTSAVGLTLHIDDCDNRPLGSVPIRVNDFAHPCCKRVGFFQTYLSMTSAGKARLRIGYDAQESCWTVADRSVGR
jgi:hypothetical protein